MSTRCQIGFYADDKDKVTKFEALMYRHSDGYPGKADGSEYGVLSVLVPFLRLFQANRGLNDTEYVAARTLQHLANEYDAEVSTYNKGRNRKDTYEFLGYGISKAFHGDIEWFYAVKPTKLEVYQVEGWDDPKFTLSETIDIPVIDEVAIP